MKRLIYMGIGLALCLFAAVWTGCDKDKEKLNESTSAEKGEENYVETAFGMELQMVYVEGGTFMMGAPDGEFPTRDGERPIHNVILDDFYIGKFEVTQSQWFAVMGTTMQQQYDKGVEASASDEIVGVGNDYPMYFVTRQEAIQFCEKLSQKAGKEYRLPTEAEWEYAARGGQNADGTKYAGSDNLDEVAWYWKNCGFFDSSHPDYGTHPVGQKKPNGLGLCDMSGNVWEVCSDWYDEDYYKYSPAVNPQGPSSGDMMVIRGDSWFDDNSYSPHCYVWARGVSSKINYRGSDMGFRVVCEAK